MIFESCLVVVWIFVNLFINFINVFIKFDIYWFIVIKVNNWLIFNCLVIIKLLLNYNIKILLILLIKFENILFIILIWVVLRFKLVNLLNLFWYFF